MGGEQSSAAAAPAKPGTGTLEFGLKIGDTCHRDFELRQVTTGDYFAAEADAALSKDLSFRGALLVRQLVRIGSFTGPFSMELIAKIPPPDFQRLCDAREALELSGEGWQRG